MRIVTKDEKQFTKAHPYDGGFDITASLATIVPARGFELVETGLRVEIPVGYVGFLKSRSGLAVRHGLEVGAGVIDCGYTGEVKVLLRNHSDTAYTIDSGDKIAQLVILPTLLPCSIEYADTLEDSDRGEGGFNSSGYK